VQVSDQLLAANTWQTFKVNLGSITTASPTGATWQFSYQMIASQWGGVGFTSTLAIDNLTLTHLANPLTLASSANPSAYQAPVTFTATVTSNGVTAGNATGTVVFSAPSGPFSTNSVASGAATSAAISSLPVGTDAITALYSGGNYPAGTNVINQFVSAPTGPGIAQANLPIYTDNLVNGFQNWSWATVNFANFSPVHSGSYSIAVTDGGYQGLSFQRSDFSTAPYSSISFWANGGTSGGQLAQVYGTLDDNGQAGFSLPPLTANKWVQYTVPLSALGMVNATNCSGFVIQGTSGGAQPTFYVDDVQLVAATPPATVHLGVNAAQVLHPVDARQFGLNTATWDGVLGAPATLTSLQTMGTSALRWPGGSTSDGYHWTSDLSGNATFQHIATNIGAQVFTTVNYGSGTASEAAAWVLFANKTNNCGFKYWEVGNECYGTWENDTHAVQHDPYTYATNAVAYIQAMKQAYPTVPIKIGVVAVPGEGSFVNNMNHFAVNPRTGTTNYGWTPVMLATMKSLGVMPDFIIYHFYWQYTTSGWTFYTPSADSDPLLLQVAENPAPSDWSDWASAAASLRQQLTDYVGASAGSNIELCVTENNSDAGAMGRQSTSLVNALYLADSTGQLMKTEFRSYLWWDLHNGSETDGNFDPTIYGWRTAGDYGVLDGSNNPYPTYYAEKLLQYFARSGDSVLNGTSDNPLLSAYAVRRTNGTLTLLVINKDMVTNLNAQIGLTNFAPSASATIQSYGLPQDQATENNLSPALQDIATTNFSGVGASFSYNFPPMSLTLFTISPGASTLSVAGIQGGQLKLVLQGQPGVSYVTQSSPDLTTWTPVSTNLLAGSSTNINVPYSPGTPKQFYRAVSP
jgi:alpha-L-arabinofuranosidase